MNNSDFSISERRALLSKYKSREGWFQPPYPSPSNYCLSTSRGESLIGLITPCAQFEKWLTAGHVHLGTGWIQDIPNYNGKVGFFYIKNLWNPFPLPDATNKSENKSTVGFGSRDRVASMAGNGNPP